MRCAVMALSHSSRMVELAIPALRYSGVSPKWRTPKRRSMRSTGEVVQ